MVVQEPLIVGTPTDLDGAQGYLDDEVVQGRFTPFLGAGASSLRPPETDLETEPWHSIWISVLAIRGGLQTPSQLHYLQSFAEQRLRIGKAAKRQLEGTPEQMLEAVAGAEANAGEESPLPKFQRTLVRLAAEMGVVFGKAFAESYTAVGLLGDLAVKINPEDKKHEDLIAALLLAVDLAANLPGNPYPPGAILRGKSDPPTLQQDRIYERLLMLARQLVNSSLWDSDKNKEWRDRHHARIEQLGKNLGQPTAGEVTIRGEMLEWLPDLLWYTLRFWTPLLPTTSEMAFELALRANLAPPKKADLAQAAEALNLLPAALAKAINDWFRYCHERRDPLTSFHLAIAAALQRSHDLYDSRQQERNRSSNSADSLAANPPAVVFTTNFDKCVEAVFKTLDITHHVVFPVRPRNTTKVKWRLTTSFASDDEHRGEGDYDLEDQLEIEVRGPIIVKLHGSPLDPAGNAEHWLVLSEHGYLEALLERNLPPWLDRQLAAQGAEGGEQRPNRSLWFLGYSISDWNVRLRLYVHLRQSQVNPLKHAIDRSWDLFRMTILKRLGVGVFVGDLQSRLPGMILRALNQVPAGNRSPALESLLEKLEETIQ
ncbi:MAG TPA: SIR2 family protein [Thermoanaerobaculia bacterium]|nr:SIR2 family protein [Thermoanaerobaculia bacterium]